MIKSYVENGRGVTSKVMGPEGIEIVIFHINESILRPIKVIGDPNLVS